MSAACHTIQVFFFLPSSDLYMDFIIITYRFAYQIPQKHSAMKNCYVLYAFLFWKIMEFIRYDILDEISETRIYCGFREKMIQVANRPCDVVAMEWPIC